MSGFAEWLQASGASNTIQTVTWIIPLLQSVHIVTIGIVFVSSLMIALRVLGWMRTDEPFPSVWARFSPWMWGGLVIMAVTGVLLIIGEPVREFTALSFWLKMTLLAVVCLTTALFGRSLARGTLASAARFPLPARAAAIGIVVLWLAIIFLGRAIAYDVEVWGRLALHS